MTHNNIIKSCTDSIISMITMGFSKFDSSLHDQDLDEVAENHISLSAGYALENLAKLIGDAVLNPIFDYISPKLGSADWGDRYLGMIAFGSIIDGPNPTQIITIIHTCYANIIGMINDSVAKVRQTVAFVYYKLSEFVPELIFTTEENLNLFITHIMEHIHEHHLISTLLIGALKNLFIQAHKNNSVSLLNSHFELIFNKLAETMYRQDIH